MSCRRGSAMDSAEVQRRHSQRRCLKSVSVLQVSRCHRIVIAETLAYRADSDRHGIPFPSVSGRAESRCRSSSGQEFHQFTSSSCIVQSRGRHHRMNSLRHCRQIAASSLRFARSSRFKQICTVSIQHVSKQASYQLRCTVHRTS